MTEADPWWVKGTLFENCTCQLLCPAHVSFKQDCDEDPCVGFWGIHVFQGRFGRLALARQNAAVLYEAPRRMHTAGWKIRICLDAGADEAQRAALEKILGGEVGGPWAILSKFFTERLETRVVPMRFEDSGKEKRLAIEGVLDTVICRVESKRSGEPATLGNLFNVIHSTIQYLARGSSQIMDKSFLRETKEKHALYSEFSWTGP